MPPGPDRENPSGQALRPDARYPPTSPDATYRDIQSPKRKHDYHADYTGSSPGSPHWMATNLLAAAESGQERLFIMVTQSPEVLSGSGVLLSGTVPPLADA